MAGETVKTASIFVTGAILGIGGFIGAYVALSGPSPTMVTTADSAKKRNPEQNIQRVLLDHFESGLVDPESVRYRDLEYFDSAADEYFQICGYANAKNKMGGYAGFRGFIATYDKGEMKSFSVLEGQEPCGDSVFRVSIEPPPKK